MNSANSLDLVEEFENKNTDLDKINKLSELYETHVASNSDDGEAWKNFGHCSLILGNDKKAHECYQKALILKGTEDIELWHGIGLLYYKNNSLEYAEPSFLKVVTTCPDYKKNYLINFKLGLIFKRFFHYTNAIEFFSKCLDSDEKVSAFCQMGHCYNQLNKLDEALNSYKRAYELTVSTYTTLCLGWFLSKSDSKLALEYLNQGLGLCRKDTVEELDLLYAIARVLHFKGDFQEASNCFYKLLNKNSGDVNFWNSFGIMCAETNQSSQAFRSFIKASEVSSTSAEVWNNIGALYWKSGQINESKMAYEKAKKFNSSIVKEETKEFIQCDWNISELPYVKRNAIIKVKYDFKETELPIKPPVFVNPNVAPQNFLNNYAAMVSYFNYIRHANALRLAKDRIGSEDDKQAAKILTDLSLMLPNKRNREL